ncbi:MAG TPA: class I SAM-dependent methyltransferase [Polyangiaceae bacterium]|nr:class I SAM-dependent methyltransferase [Polyangiaceae bacterium]
MRAAYDRAARVYDHWEWQTFWTRNEMELVRELLLGAEPQPRRAIDIGTGTGRYLSLLAELGIEATGIDTSLRMLDVARKRLGPQVRLMQADLLELDVGEFFDCILACRVLSHIAELAEALASLTKLASPGAILVLTDIHPQHAYERTRIALGKRDLEIPTFKHDPSAIAVGLETRGWRVMSHRDVGYGDLLWRPVRGFRSIDRSGVRPVFYVLTAIR